MNNEELQKDKENLEGFLADYVSFLEKPIQPENDRRELQRKTTFIARIVESVHGGGFMELGSVRLSFSSQLGLTLEEISNHYRDIDVIESHVKRIINEAIGNINNGTLPSIKIAPILPIKDTILKKRCLDLLNAPGSFDRVINQATQVLEDRLRSKLPFEQLCIIIPESKNQIGENLAHKLLAPPNPAIIVSNKSEECSAFHKIMVGIIAYLRHPSHHLLNDDTEWALAWSVVGIVDSLLFET